jgi:hypothetical protein
VTQPDKLMHKLIHVTSAHDRMEPDPCTGSCEHEPCILAKWDCGVNRRDAAGLCLLKPETRLEQPHLCGTSDSRTRALNSGVRPIICSQGNIDAADILGAGEALAYGVGSAVAVADVRRMKLATVLAGGHRGAAVTAVAWWVLRHSTGNLRLLFPAHLVAIHTVSFEL